MRWEITFGNGGVVGWYSRRGDVQLYVRPARGTAGAWAWYVDGVLFGAEADPERARRQAEATVGATVLKAKVGAVAAAARKAR